MELIHFIVNVKKISNEIGMVLVLNKIHVIHHHVIKMQLVIILMVDNIVVCVQQHIQVFNVMKILMNVQFFHLFVEMVVHVLMKLVPIDVIVHLVG